VRVGGAVAIGLFVLVGACTSASSITTTTLASPTSTSPAVSFTTQGQNATTVAPTTTTTEVLPDEPIVAAGWSLQSGDLLVSGHDGVRVVRDGAVVSQPVTSPVELTLDDGYGGILFTTPRPELFPDHWPILFGGGGYVIWRLSPDGSLEKLHDSGDSGWSLGAIDLSRVDLLSLRLGEPPTLLYTQVERIGSTDQYSDTREAVVALTLGPPWEPPGNPIKLPIETPGEGGVTGLGFQETEGRLIMSTASDGGGWLSAWTADGSPLAWATNPIPEGTPCPDDPGFSHCLWSATTVPGTSLIAYLETDAHRNKTDLVIYDTTTGAEQHKLQIPTNGAIYVENIHASATQIVISRLTYESSAYRYLPMLLVDVETGAINELPITGIATLVR